MHDMTEVCVQLALIAGDDGYNLEALDRDFIHYRPWQAHLIRWLIPSYTLNGLCVTSELTNRKNDFPLQLTIFGVMHNGSAIKVLVDKILTSSNEDDVGTVSHPTSITSIQIHNTSRSTSLGHSSHPSYGGFLNGAIDDFLDFVPVVLFYHNGVSKAMSQSGFHCPMLRWCSMLPMDSKLCYALEHHCVMVSTVTTSHELLIPVHSALMGEAAKIVEASVSVDSHFSGSLGRPLSTTSSTYQLALLLEEYVHTNGTVAVSYIVCFDPGIVHNPFCGFNDSDTILSWGPILYHEMGRSTLYLSDAAVMLGILVLFSFGPKRSIDYDFDTLKEMTDAISVVLTASSIFYTGCFGRTLLARKPDISRRMPTSHLQNIIPLSAFAHPEQEDDLHYILVPLLSLSACCFVAVQGNILCCLDNSAYTIPTVHALLKVLHYQSASCLSMTWHLIILELRWQQFLHAKYSQVFRIGSMNLVQSITASVDEEDVVCKGFFHKISMQLLHDCGQKLCIVTFTGCAKTDWRYCKIIGLFYYSVDILRISLQARYTLDTGHLNITASSLPLGLVFQRSAKACIHGFLMLVLPGSYPLGFSWCWPYPSWWHFKFGILILEGKHFFVGNAASWVRGCYTFVPKASNDGAPLGLLNNSFMTALRLLALLSISCLLVEELED